jgi:preprotein translocase subunit SecD
VDFLGSNGTSGMSKDIRWRVAVIVGVIAMSVWGFYPPSEKINLGLDLRGGVHLVMRVETDDALRRETETAVERLREALRRENVAFATLEVTGLTEFRADGLQDGQAFRRVVGDVAPMFESLPSAGGYRIRPNLGNQLRDEAVQQALQTIERRVDELGVVEPIIARHGGRDQILVQLPGVTDVQRAKDIIRSTALLELTLAEQGPFPTEESALHAYRGALPSELELLPGIGAEYYVLRRVPVVAGRDLRGARPSVDQFNRPAVSFSLTREAALRFGPFTEQHIGRQLAIVLDSRVVSAPVLQGRISDEGQITGNFTTQEAQDLSVMLRSGALPASLTYLEERTVGPSLGEESIRSGVSAALGAFVFVMVFMLFFYRLAGLNAIVSVVVNLLILLGMMAYLGATMTLPGFAGFILTVGIGVDSNILIFEPHQGGAGSREGCACSDQCRLRPSLVDHRRHACRLAHRRDVPVPVRDGPHPRFRHDARDRPPGQCLHGCVRIADHVRDCSAPPARRRVEHLRKTAFHYADPHQRQHRLATLAMARARPLGVDHPGRWRSVAHQGPATGH